MNAVLTGTRIRDRRADLGMRQAELAQRVGISASYLNLIEHNRRRIGGKLLGDIAEILQVDMQVLTAETGSALLAGLSSAADIAAEAGALPEIGKTDEFARRYPGWADTVMRLAQRIEKQEHSIKVLTDRLAHDPNLSESLHEVLSTATAIRSSADILAEPGEIDPTWQVRFHKNIQEDAQRLTEGAQALVSYLDNAPDTDNSAVSADEQFENWLSEQGFHLPALENVPQDDTILESVPQIARSTAQAFFKEYARDAKMVSVDDLLGCATDASWDPVLIAHRLGIGLDVVLRRLASIPPDRLGEQIGRVSCDAAGVITFRKPVAGFDMPHFGGACALWGLFQALSRPMFPHKGWIEQVARVPHRYITYSYAVTRYPRGYESPPVTRSEMILIPETLIDPRPTDPPLRVGQSCQICPRKQCDARREASILGDWAR